VPHNFCRKPPALYARCTYLHSLDTSIWTRSPSFRTPLKTVAVLAELSPSGHLHPQRILAIVALGLITGPGSILYLRFEDEKHAQVSRYPSEFVAINYPSAELDVHVRTTHRRSLAHAPPNSDSRSDWISCTPPHRVS
jgi:hypothetical protein